MIINNEIPFVEEIPDNWKLIQNKYLFKYDGKKVGKDFDKYQLLSLTTSGVKEKSIAQSGGKTPESYEGYQTVKKGQMIFCLFDLDCSAVFSGLSEFDGMITSAYDVFSTNDIIDNRFISYWFNYVFSNRYYKLYSKNIRYTITSEMFGNIKTPIPPKEQQIKIANYLDEKIKKIDELIEVQNKEIEKLKEYKTTVITNAVTKGLNKNIPMKDSGIYWLGEVPKHWKVGRIKDFYQEVDKKNTEELPYFALENIESGSGQFVETNNVYGIEGSIRVNPGDVVFGKLRPYLAKTYLVQEDMCCSSEFAVFRSKKENETEYLKFVFLSSLFVDVINSSTKGTKMPRANIEFIKTLGLAIPDSFEQEIIIKEIKIMLDNINQLIFKKEEKIKKLNEYKNSLIYEYVTGKKEIK